MSRLPDPILAVLLPPPESRDGGDWAAGVVVGKQWLVDDDGPPFAWVQVENSGAEYDSPVIGASGAVVGVPTVSSRDFEFHHPFGNDWECFIELDQEFIGLLSPFNDGSHRPGDAAWDPDSPNDYAIATAGAASAPTRGDHRGVLGVEWDAQLVPSQFRPSDGDRIAVFGRWIVDAGHGDFHTEIHPPLLMVSAHAAGQTTSATLIARSYLVSQHWPEGSFRTHLVAELEKAASVILSERLKAHPTVWRIPYAGRQELAFRLLAPTEAGPSDEPLSVHYSFVARTGVTVQMMTAEPRGVDVRVTLDASTTKPSALPSRSERSIDIDALLTEAGDGKLVPLKDLIEILIAGIPIAGLHLDWVLGRGVLTDSYTLPADWLPPIAPGFGVAPPMTTVDVASLGAGKTIGVTYNDQQPFPIYGWIHIGWGEEPRQLKASVTYQGSDFTVTLTDAASGAPVSGTILIANRPSGPTGEPRPLPERTWQWSPEQPNPEPPHSVTPGHWVAVGVTVAVQADGYPPLPVVVNENTPPPPRQPPPGE